MGLIFNAIKLWFSSQSKNGSFFPPKTLLLSTFHDIFSLASFSNHGKQPSRLSDSAVRLKDIAAARASRWVGAVNQARRRPAFQAAQERVV